MSDAESSPQLKSPLIGERGRAGCADDIPNHGHLQPCDPLDADVIDGDVTGLPVPRPASLVVRKKLKYQDFVANRSRRGANDKTDTFHTLVYKANEWLHRNRDLQVQTCETLRRMNTNPKILADTDKLVQTNSIAHHGSTYHLRAFRLWLVPRPEGKGKKQTILFKDFEPDTDDNFATLLDKVNSDIDRREIQGRIVTVETMSVPVINQRIDTVRTNWSESSNKDYDHVFIIRVFYTQDECAREHVAMNDFVPLPVDDGYEGSDQLAEKANDWLKEQSHMRVINIQSLLFQKREHEHADMGSSCFFTAPGIQNNRSVEYFRIMRVVCARPASDDFGSRSSVQPIVCEIFTPALMTRGGGRGREKMEKMKDIFANITEYLAMSGADVVCAETVMNPFQVSEATDDERSACEMRWLLTTRVYTMGPLHPFDPVFMAKLAKHSFRYSKRKAREGNAHRPIFLAKMVNRRHKSRMVIAAVALIVSMLIIVVLSVYSFS